MGRDISIKLEARIENEWKEVELPFELYLGRNSTAFGWLDELPSCANDHGNAWQFTLYFEDLQHGYKQLRFQDEELYYVKEFFQPLYRLMKALHTFEVVRGVRMVYRYDY